MGCVVILYDNDLPVPLYMTPITMPGRLLRCQRLLHILQQGRSVLLRPYIDDPHPKELLFTIAIMQDGRLIHLQELQRLLVIDPFRKGALIE